MVDLTIKQPWLKPKQEALSDLLNYCPSSSHVDLVADLIDRTLHVTENGFGSAIKAIGDHIENAWKLPAARTWFVSSNHKENTDSSQEVLNRIKAYHWSDLTWNRRQFFTRYRDVEKQLRDGDTVVVVDDFVGTGKSMMKTIDWFRKAAKAKGLTIDLRVCVVAACSDGAAKLAVEGVTAFHVHTVGKAISGAYKGHVLTAAISAMTDLEDKLAVEAKGSITDYRFGYGKSEAMYQRDGGNTPNNVFPLFWWRPLKSGARQTIMHRT